MMKNLFKKIIFITGLLVTTHAVSAAKFKVTERPVPCHNHDAVSLEVASHAKTPDSAKVSVFTEFIHEIRTHITDDRVTARNMADFNEGINPQIACCVCLVMTSEDIARTGLVPFLKSFYEVMLADFVPTVEHQFLSEVALRQKVEKTIVERATADGHRAAEMLFHESEQRRAEGRHLYEDACTIAQGVVRESIAHYFITQAKLKIFVRWCEQQLAQYEKALA